jgi:hypothetical protein
VLTAPADDVPEDVYEKAMAAMVSARHGGNWRAGIAVAYHAGKDAGKDQGVREYFSRVIGYQYSGHASPMAPEDITIIRRAGDG